MNKRYFQLFLFNMLALCTFAQSPAPIIKSGTTVNYTFILHGQTRKMDITYAFNSDSVRLDWSLNSDTGTYMVTPEGWKNGNVLSFQQPEPQQTIVLKPSETFAFISVKAFNDLLSKHSFVYSNTTYTLKEGDSDKFIIDGHEWAVMHVLAEVDATEMWILNNPTLPLICKTIKSPLGINFSISSLK